MHHFHLVQQQQILLLQTKVEADRITDQRGGLNSVAAELLDSLKNPLSSIPQAETLIQSYDSPLTNGLESSSAQVAEDRISSFYSQDNCGTGFEVVKVTEHETVKGLDYRIVHGNQTRVPWQVFLRGEGESHVR